MIIAILAICNVTVFDMSILSFIYMSLLVNARAIVRCSAYNSYAINITISMRITNIVSANIFASTVAVTNIVGAAWTRLCTSSYNNRCIVITIQITAMVLVAHLTVLLRVANMRLLVPDMLHTSLMMSTMRRVHMLTQPRILREAIRITHVTPHMLTTIVHIKPRVVPIHFAAVEALREALWRIAHVSCALVEALQIVAAVTAQTPVVRVALVVLETSR